MPGGYGTYGPWGSAGETYSQPEPSWQPSGGGNRPPTERVWEEEREDEPTVSVDYTTPSDYIASSSDTSSPIVPFEEIPIGSTGMGVEDLKVQAQQKRAAEQKQKYIDKMKAFAASMSSSPGLYGDLYGPGGTGLGFDAASDPTIDQELYNMEKFSGDIPVSKFQKLKFLADYGIGSGLGSFMAVDSEGKLIKDSSGNPIYTGLGKTMSDQWNEAFDPGGLRYGNNPLITGGSAIRDYLEGAEDAYWTSGWDSWADPWYEGHYQGEGYDDSMSDLARHYWFSESLDDVTARKEERRKAGLGAAGMRASEMEQMYGRDFAAKANPHHDPGYSQAVTSELDPIYGSRLLWETARME